MEELKFTYFHTSFTQILVISFILLIAKGFFMKKILLLTTLFIALYAKGFSQVVVVPPISGYPVTYTGWALLGGAAGASTLDSEIVVTHAAANQLGRVYTTASYSVTPCGQFTVNFDFQIKQSGATTIADGMAFFFLQSSVTAAEAAGYGGSGLNIPNNPNGLVLTFDTYDNLSDGQEPSIGLFDYNGSLAGYVEGSATQRLAHAYNQTFADNGSWHHCLITYDGGAIKVFFDYSATALLTGTYSINFAGQFGFCGATGGSYSTQSVKNVFIRINGSSPINGNTSICQGATTALSDSTSGGTWSSSNITVGTVSTTGVVTGIGVGTTTITYTYNAGACTATTVVTVNTQPAAITGTPIVCMGSTTALTDATAGGTWSSVTTTVGTVDGIGNVTGIGAGTTTISYTVGTCAAKQIVTVNSAPGPILGTLSVCETFTTLLSDTPAGGVWSSVTGGVATISAGGLVTGISAGTSTISYSIGGCVATAVVTVNTQPAAITGVALVCLGSVTALSDATGGGLWTSVTTTVGTVDGTGNVTGLGTGTTLISYTLGSCAATQIVTVNTAPGPINGTLSVCQTFSTSLSDAPSGGTWSSVTSTVGTVDGIGNVTGIGTGTTTISYTIGTCAVTAVVTVNIQPAPITGTPEVCVGSVTALTDATGGGTWTSTNITVGTVDGTGNVSGLAVGTTTISYTLGSCAATQNVTVNTQPGAILGTLTVCQTFTTLLSDSPAGGVWSSVTGSVATITAGGLVMGAAAGTSTISYTIGTCAATAVVTVNTQPVAITGTPEVCVGSVTALTDATGGGTWSSTNVTVGTVDGTGNVSGLTVGITTISYTLGSCVATQDVTVNTQPGAILGTLSICETFTTLLSDSPAGGVWSSVTGGVATISAGGLVTGAGAGTSTISYTIGTCAATAVVTVNTQPTAITGTPSVCVGFITTLTDATGGGTWSSTTLGVGSVDGLGNVMGTGVGTTTISYTLGTCAATLVVTVNTEPAAITGNTGPICETTTLQLSDATSGGVWSSVTGGVATISGTGLVTGAGVGTSVISYAIGSCAVTTIVTVNLQPAAITGSLAVCDGFVTALTDATVGGAWSSTIITVGTVDGLGNVTGIGLGTTTISYTIGSCAATADVTVSATPVAITGTLSVCDGFTTQLTDLTGGGAWSVAPPPGIATISGTGLVTGAGVGTATISYAIGSCAATAIVTVNTQPAAITGTLGVCDGFTTALTDATGGGVWSSTIITVGTVDVTGNVTGVGVGTTTISYTLGSCAATAEVTVSATPVAITGTLSVCNGFTTQLTDLTSGGVWSVAPPPGIATISGTGLVTGTGVGTATISYDISGCAATAVVTVNDQPAAITGSLAVCLGLTTQLSDVTAGGVWSSITTTVATITTGGLVTGGGVGNSTISYTLGTCAATAVVTVDPLPVAISGTLTVCVGSTTSLSDASGGGTWSASNGNVNISGTGVVTGLIVGTSVITYTIGTGCTITAIVTINPLPSAISGATQVCLGSTVTLSDATAGGTWSSGNALIASITVGGVVTGNLVGVTTITYKLATGCLVTSPMTVNPLPAGITGPTLVCVGSTIALTDASGGGTWSSSNNLFATVSGTGTVTGIAIGVVTITYTLPTTCYAIHTVTVNAPVAVITPLGDTTFCPGGFVVLTANTGAGLSYQWYVGGVAISGALTSSYIASISGSYQVRVTNSSGCSTTSIPMLVTADAPIAAITDAGGTTICAGTTTTLDATTGVGLTYQWLLDGVAITGANSSSYSTTDTGSYSAIVTNSTGCSATSNIITITSNPSPTANVVLSGPITFCLGGSVTMTANYEADYTYQWYNTAGVISSATGQSYTAGTSSGYYVIVTNSYGCSATSATTNVVANPLPDVTITPGGSILLCAGGSVSLNAAVVAGYIYQWYVGGSAIAGATNSAYLATTSGGYRVQVTNPATGCSDETHTDMVVTVINEAIVTPITSASYCWGSSALLTTNVSGATSTATYQWYFNGVLIPGATNAIYNATAPGDYSVLITIPGSCTMTTPSLTVTQYPLPNPIVSYASGIFYTAPYYVTYQWYKDLVMIAGATTSSTPSIGNGNYKVQVTDTNGCQSFADPYVYNGGGITYVPGVNSIDVKIYPNPAQTVVHIEAPMQVRAVISGIDGRCVMNVSEAKDIDVSNLPDGIYMITIYNTEGQKIKTDKLVKSAN